MGPPCAARGGDSLFMIAVLLSVCVSPLGRSPRLIHARGGARGRTCWLARKCTRMFGFAGEIHELKEELKRELSKESGAASGAAS